MLAKLWGVIRRIPIAHAFDMSHQPLWRRMLQRRVVLRITGEILACFIALHVWFHITNPYASFSIVDSPYTTYLEKGEIKVRKNFDLQVYDSAFMNWLGYYKSGFLIVQNTFFGGKWVPGSTSDEIVGNIHAIRFDPSKPYIISGDQFSVLYLRNLGVFYGELLDPNTAHSQKNWEDRQRIYLQSALYGLDTLAASDRINTTVVPIGHRSVTFTQVHPGSIGSDSVFGILYALDRLSTPATSTNSLYHVQTVATTQQIIEDRRDDLRRIVERYLTLVEDPETHLVKADIHLASARDGVVRDRSFYDSVILWKTRQLAQKLGIIEDSPERLAAIRDSIIAQYWSDETGCFRDSLTDPLSYSSDWLIAPTLSLIDPNHETQQLESCVAYIRENHIASPFPIKYTVDEKIKPVWAMRLFQPNYGGSTIWSYWGAEYIGLLGELYGVTGDTSYAKEAEQTIAAYEGKIVEDHGFAETFDSAGNFLRSGLYKSIRTTGWVVEFEHAREKVTSSLTEQFAF